MLSTAFVIENRKSLCHSLGRPSRSDFVQLQFDTQTGYKDNTEDAGTGNMDSYKRNAITKFSGGNAPACPSKIDGDPNLYGCVIAYEKKKEVGGNVDHIFKDFTVANI